MSDYLTLSSIETLVESYKTSKTERKVTPLEDKKTNLEELSTNYTTLQTDASDLKSIVKELSKTTSSSVLKSKTTTSTDDSIATATATGSASVSSYTLSVQQLAKSDIAISEDLDSDTASTLTGTQTIKIKTGDGEGGEYTSYVTVEFDDDETNESAMEEIRSAINNDKAIITSNSYVATDSYTGGSSTLTFDLNGTETEVTVAGGGTYEDLIDEMVSTINDDVDGVTALKVTDTSGNVSLKVTVSSSSNYISISDTSGYALASSLDIVATKEKAASGCVSASSFAPSSGYTQFSITSRNTGTGYRITELSDDSGGTILDSLGLNLGTTRPTYAQNTSGTDTSGFRYSDITEAATLLDSKFTFNGLSLQRDSNTISDLTTGVSFKLNSVTGTDDDDVTISVTADADAIQTKIESFITKFNTLYTYLKSNTSYSSGERGALTGNSIAKAILKYMSSISTGKVDGLGSDALDTLSDIGLSFDASTGLSISDASTLSDELTNNASQVEDLFNSTDGIATKLYEFITPYLGSGGYLDKQISSLKTRISDLTDAIEEAEEQIEESADNLRDQYTQLLVQLSNLELSSSSFTSS